MGEGENMLSGTVQREKRHQNPWEGNHAKWWAENHPHMVDAMCTFLVAVRTARVLAGLTQRELAAKVGASESEIAEFECGDVAISAEIYRRVRELLKIEVLRDAEGAGVGFTIETSNGEILPMYVHQVRALKERRVSCSGVLPESIPSIRLPHVSVPGSVS